MLTLKNIEIVKEQAQKMIDQEYRDFFDKPAPKISAGLVHVVLKAAIEAKIIKEE